MSPEQVANMFEEAQRNENVASQRKSMLDGVYSR